jgi:hypothetical protein
MKSLKQTALAALAMFALSGCIKEDNEWCPPDTIQPTEPTIEEMMTVEYSVPEDVLNGSLFVFDSNRKLIRHVRAAQETLLQEKQIPLTPQELALNDTIYVAAWANIDENMDMPTPPRAGDDMSKTLLHIQQSLTHEGFAEPLDMVLHGVRMIVLGEAVDALTDRFETAEDGVTVTKLIHEVHIRPINARLTVQVEGLPLSEAEEYHFEFEKQNSGYTYEGGFIADERFSTDTMLHEMYGYGVFDRRGFLLTEETYEMVPSLGTGLPEDMTQEQAMTLHVYRNVDGEVIDLAGEVSKVHYGDGDWIGLYSGQTTNVLIRLLDGGGGGPIGEDEIVVYVKVTPWEEIYQWSVW